ncbi:MAG: DUF2723 domain-containing protein [Actinobacteria bacterium]|nr:DUF2723 domain-containing protein [Actinomycetota bacterium]
MLFKAKGFILKYKIVITASLAFSVPFIIYLLTLEHKLVGGDTTWYAIQIPQMKVLVPTGYPTFSLIGKLMSIIPIGDLAYRLNLISAIFGALTILFLFLAVNKLVKNEFISLAGSLSFAFLFIFWFFANRLEFDTLNSFFIALIIYTALLYNESKQRRDLYLFFFCIGLSLTDHPIAFFVMPAFLIYIIIINPKIFKSFKAIVLSLVFLILPLILYVYIPIRSLQGYGTVTTLKKFIYYVTGRKTTGEVHGGTFGDKNLHEIFNVFKEFILIIYNNFGIVLIIIAIAGFVYLWIKNWKFALVSIFIPLLTMLITSQYLTWAPENYTIDSMLIITVYVSFGFLLLMDITLILFKKFEKKNKNKPGNEINKVSYKRKQYLRYSIIILLLIFFISQPTLLAVGNYKKADLSKPEGIYLFWKEAFKNIENDSILYVTTASANVGYFIYLYELQNKNIKFITNEDKEYSVNEIKDNIKKGKKLYFIGNDNNINLNFDLQKIGKSYYWPRYNENLSLYQITDAKFYIDIKYNIDSTTKKAGDKFSLEYVIRNLLNNDVAISSVELELPEDVVLTGVEPQGSINVFPGKSQGKYMWVSNNYIIKGGSRINLILDLQAQKTGELTIKFRVSTNNVFVKADDLIIKVQD